MSKSLKIRYILKKIGGILLIASLFLLVMFYYGFKGLGNEGSDIWNLFRQIYHGIFEKITPNKITAIALCGVIAVVVIFILIVLIGMDKLSGLGAITFCMFGLSAVVIIAKQNTLRALWNYAINKDGCIHARLFVIGIYLLCIGSFLYTFISASYVREAAKNVVVNSSPEQNAAPEQPKEKKPAVQVNGNLTLGNEIQILAYSHEAYAIVSEVDGDKINVIVQNEDQSENAEEPAEESAEEEQVSENEEVTEEPEETSEESEETSEEVSEEETTEETADETGEELSEEAAPAEEIAEEEQAETEEFEEEAPAEELSDEEAPAEELSDEEAPAEELAEEEAPAEEFEEETPAEEAEEISEESAPEPEEQITFTDSAPADEEIFEDETPVEEAEELSDEEAPVEDAAEEETPVEEFRFDKPREEEETEPAEETKDENEEERVIFFTASEEAPEEAPEENAEDADEEDDEDADEEDDVEDEAEAANGDDALTGNKLVINAKKSNFDEKVLNASDETKDRYNQIKNVIMSYKNVRTRLSRTGDSFRYKGQKYVYMNIVGKTLRVYLALDPTCIDSSVYHQSDVSNKKKYQSTPTLLKVKSNLSVKKAIKLIEAMFDGEEIEKRKKYDEQDYAKELCDIAAARVEAAKQEENPENAETPSDTNGEN